MTWNPNHTPCTPAWWNQWGCAAPPCSPCSWTVPPGLPQPVAPMSPYYPFAPYAPPYPGYGFDSGCCSAPPLAWAPPQLPPPYARLCPSYYVGGACCDECAQGEPCAGAAPCCEECASGLPCAGNCPASPMPIEVAMAQAQAMQGPHVGALYVSDADLDALGTAVAQMGSDVDAAASAERQAFAHAVSIGAAEKACFAANLKWDLATQKCVQVDDPTHASYTELLKQAGLPVKLTEFQNERWTPFQLKWNAYRGQTIHEPTGYDVLRTELATLMGEWTGPLGQKTTAVLPKPQDETNPFPWKWVYLGGALLLLPFYLPVLSGLFLFLTKGKSLGLAAHKEAA